LMSIVLYLLPPQVYMFSFFWGHTCRYVQEMSMVQINLEFLIYLR
jgi:hypothetical protein